MRAFECVTGLIILIKREEGLCFELLRLVQSARVPVRRKTYSQQTSCLGFWTKTDMKHTIRNKNSMVLSAEGFFFFFLSLSDVFAYIFNIIMRNYIR